MNIAVIHDCKMTYKKLHNERLKTPYILDHSHIKMRGSRKQFSLVQDPQTGHKTHWRITHKYAYTTFNVGCQKWYWIWVRNCINFLLSLSIYFVPRRNFLCRPQIWPRKREKFLFSLTLSSRQHYFDELVTNIKWYLHCLSLTENGIFHYPKSEFLPIFRCSPLKSAVRHGMPQHNPLTITIGKVKHLPR